MDRGREGMNANELAEIIQHLENAKYVGASKAATMLRQQQVEIEALKKEAALQRLSDFTQNAQRTSLTDQDILKMAADKFHYSEYKLVIDFARAILKKAQE